VTGAANLFEQQARNRRQTAAWVVLFVLFFAWLGFGGDAVLYFQSVDQFGRSHYPLPFVGIIVTAIALVVAWRSWTKGPKQILWSTGATELTSPTTFEEKQLVNVVEEMAIAAGIPRPRVYLVQDPDPNAFATGHGPGSSSIAVTTGLVQTLNREELQGVVGHEMSHIRNLDVRLMTMVAALIGVVVVLSDGMGRFIGMGGGRVGGRAGSGLLGGRSGRKGGGGVLALVLLVIWIITLILAPLITRIMAMAISRNREYLADATSAELTRNPAALASALEKIESAVAPTTSIRRGTAHLCIADPLGRSANLKEGRLADLFGTHPPMVKRITILKGMAYQQVKTAGTVPPA
jgi:heat shock protein HtpX